MECKRSQNESADDFFVRVGLTATAHQITWEQAADILNKDTNCNFGESAYRKKFKAFYAGMQYQSSKNTEDIATKILSLSDLHIPYQREYHQSLSEYAGNIDILQLNGDIVDCQAISKFPKTYRKSSMEEITMARCYLIELIEFLRPKKVVVNYGNHDLRFQNYLAKNLEDSDLLELMPKTSLELIFVDGFNRYNKELHTKVHYDPLIEVFPDITIEYHDSWFSQIGKTIFCHPSAFSSAMMRTAENARRYFKDEGYDFTSLVMAHTHRTGHYDVGNTTIYEQGAFCLTKKMNYSDGKLITSQREGFIYVCQDSNGNIIDRYTSIVKLN